MPPFLIESLQRLGRALMLPIAILPIAGLLLRLGDVDLLDIPLVHDAGKAIFANLALIFAIGIAVGFARDNNGTAGLAGAIGYLVMISVLKVIDPGIDMGVLSGIISGLVAGALYNLARYFAGDPKGGQFMAGMFPVMMFGLPAACLAMYRNARAERRKLIGGLLLSMALTAFLTGVTEPVEFAFMFLAPLLYLLHALLTGLSMALTDLLDIRLGFTFSGGAIDLALGWGRSTHGWMLWPLGLLYAGIYYLVFDFCIRRFNLKTPGREDDASSESGDNAEAERAPAFIRALGGAANLEVVDACTTRLRLRLVDRDKASDAQLKALGAMAVVRPGKAGSLQVVVGPQADSIADEIRRALPFDTQPGEAVPPLGSPHTAEEVVAMQATVDAAEARPPFLLVRGKLRRPCRSGARLRRPGSHRDAPPSAP